jgi:hypothetical protein
MGARSVRLGLDRARFIAAAAAIGILMALSACGLLRRSVPVECRQRDSIWGEGYVIEVRNKTDKTLSLWIETEEKKAYFTLEPHGSKEFGWLEGFHFGDNSSYTIGGEGYSIVTLATEDSHH